MNFTKKNDIIIILLLWLIIVGLQLFLYINPLPGNTLFWQMLQDVGHTPLFGITGICLLIILSRYFRHRFSSHLQLYIVAFFLSLTIAGLTEIIQLFSPDRNVELIDFVRGILGSASFLLFYSLIDPVLNAENTIRKTGIVSIISLSLFLAGIYPILTLSADYLHKQQAFPTLLTFNEGWPLSFLDIRDARLVTGNAPQYPGGNTSPAYATFRPDKTASWPFMRLDEVTEDWSSYSSIEFNIILEFHEPTPITILLDDQKARAGGRHSQRYQSMLVPGANQITLPLSANNPGATATSIQRSKMASIWIAFPAPRPTGNILIGEITLR